jgi:succinylglutamic semialdehyde dehydrogenase
MNEKNALNQSAHYIHGQWVTGAGKAFVSQNPTDNSILWQGRFATPLEICNAYDAARAALPSWSRLPLEARANHLLAFSQHVSRHADALSTLISLETGKPHWEAKTETQAVIAKINISITAHQERSLDKKTTDKNQITSGLRFKPHGVFAVLGPFNFPAHLSNGHIVPALLAGNTLIHKPSELTPAVAAFIMQCWHDSGLPAGVLNLIHGDARVATQLLNEDIQGVAFTGSYRAGLSIHESMSRRPEVLLALEMGGNNALVVDHVSNIPAAVYQTLLSSFITAGQRCTCARRLMVPNSDSGDAFLKQLIQACQRLRIGRPMDQPEPFMGPVISHPHALQHLSAQSNLEALGGKSLLPMRQLHENSAFLSPGLLDMTSVSNVPDEEIFAPLLQIYRYDHFEEAMALANQTRYGLAAGLFSDHAATYETFYQTIRAGLIYWNRPTTGASSLLPFGGCGRSGNHRPSAFFATDYCAYPIASLEQDQLSLPDQGLPGILLE